MRDTFSQVIYTECKDNPNLIVVVADHGNDIFHDLYTNNIEKFINVGIAEQNLYGVSAGLTNAGFLPIAYALSSLGLTRAYDQIRIDIGYSSKPVLIVGDGIGFVYGTQGITHHAFEDVGMMSNIPNLTILSPSDAISMKACLYDYIANPRPVYLRISKNSAGEVYKEGEKFSINEPNLVISNNSEIVVISTASMSATIKKIISDNNILVDMIDVICLDQSSINTFHNNIGQYRKIIVIEEHMNQTGLSSKISNLITTFNLDVRMKSYGTNICFDENTGDRDFYLKKNSIDLDSLFKILKDSE
jgi:transketolase